MKLKKAIIIVSYGTAKASAREKCIEPLFELFQETYEDVNVIQAFTSGYVRKKMEEEGQVIFSPKEAIETMIEEGCREIYLQPTHLLPGHEYHRIVEAIDDVCKRETKVKIFLGRALLSPKNDMTTILHILKKHYGLNEEKTRYVFMGHGTDHIAHQQYEAIEDVACQEDLPVIVGTIENGLEEVIKKLKAIKVHSVQLIPLLFVAGDHVMNDMMGKRDSWKTLLEEEGYSVICHPVGLGEIEEIRNYYLQQFQDEFSHI